MAAYAASVRRDTVNRARAQTFTKALTGTLSIVRACLR